MAVIEGLTSGGKVQPIQVDTNGVVQTSGSGGGGGGNTTVASVGNTSASVPSQADYIGMNVGGTLTGVPGTANGLKVDGSAVTQPVSLATLPVTNAGTFAVQASGGVSILNGATTAAVKAASTAPVATDPALVVTASPNGADITAINAVATAVTAAAISVPLATTGNTASDGSTTITTGGTAQNLYAAATPTNGFAIYNPDPANDLWVSDSTTALANGTGSIRVAANGGSYETPPTYKPYHAVSIVGAVTGQKITARKW